MAWRQYILELGSLDHEALETALFAYGALSVTYSDRHDNPVLEPQRGETPLWPHTRVTALFDDALDLANLPQYLTKQFPDATVNSGHIETLEDCDWERQWLEHFKPVKFGQNLWIIPDNQTIDEADAIKVHIDPGLAFGTGTHPTTALCLEWLASNTPSNKSVFDYGCGSGILSVAAAVLGARQVMAMDIDPQAVTATQQNAARNKVSSRIEATTSLQPSAEAFDVVIGNILAGILINNVDFVLSKLAPAGTLVLSGILEEQRDEVIAAYSPSIQFANTTVQDGWVCLSGIRNGS